MMDYHFIATNFAFTNRFPVTGYILDTAAYKIKPNKELGLVYLDMFRKNGPVTTFLRTPLYPLLVGCIYKIWGFKYYYNLRLNILLLSIIIGFMPYVGFSNWGIRGFYSGALGGLIFLKNCHDHWFLNTMDIEIFSTFLFFLLFAMGLLAERKDKPVYYVLWGASIGLFLLSKPLLMAMPVLFAVFIFIKYRSMSFRFMAKRILEVLIGIALAVSPWSIYINYVKHATVSQRESWCSRVLASTERPEISNADEYSESYSDTTNIARYEMSIKTMRYIVKTLWMYHARNTPFIFITNASGDVLLDLNNEYCNDGGMHFEWLFIKSSFYRSYCSESQPTATKLFLFYTHHPSFLFRIIRGRFTHTFTENYQKYYWLAAALWGLCVIQIQLFSIRDTRKKIASALLLLSLCALAYLFSCIFSKYAALLLYTPLFCFGLFFYKVNYKDIISATFPLIYLGLFLFMFIIFPNPNYMLVAMPISCLCMIYFSLLLAGGFSILAFGANSHLRNEY